MSLPTLEVAAPAKLNLALSVGAPGPDRMHPISSWMVTVDFADTLHLTRLPEGRRSMYAILWASDAPRASEIDWPIQKDLAVRAHLALERLAGRALPLRMRLEKRIPVGGGLGGGSSNAAAMLRGVNDLFDLRIPAEDLHALAAGLGSDVPFLVRGGSAIVEGLGERIEHLARVPDVHAVLAFPDAACPTGAVYGRFDALRPGAVVQAGRVRALAEGGSIAADAPFNDLAAPACAVAPVLEDLIEEIEAVAGRRAHVSGSGSTLFVLATGRLEADLLAAEIARRVAVPAVATSAR